MDWAPGILLYVNRIKSSLPELLDVPAGPRGLSFDEQLVAFVAGSRKFCHDDAEGN